MLASCGDDEPDELGFYGKYPMYFLDAANPDVEAAARQLRFDVYLDAAHPTNIPIRWWCPYHSALETPSTS